MTGNVFLFIGATNCTCFCFWVSSVHNFFRRFFLSKKKKLFFMVLSWQRSLLCIVRELAGGGSVAVAVGVSDS